MKKQKKNQKMKKGKVPIMLFWIELNSFERIVFEILCFKETSPESKTGGNDNFQLNSGGLFEGNSSSVTEFNEKNSGNTFGSSFNSGNSFGGGGSGNFRGGRGGFRGRGGRGGKCPIRRR